MSVLHRLSLWVAAGNILDKWQRLGWLLVSCVIWRHLLLSGFVCCSHILRLERKGFFLSTTASLLMWSCSRCSGVNTMLTNCRLIILPDTWRRPSNPLWKWRHRHKPGASFANDFFFVHKRSPDDHQIRVTALKHKKNTVWMYKLLGGPG